MKQENKDILSTIGYIAFWVLVIGGLIFGIFMDCSYKKKYGDTRYELVIIDMYEDIGSTWHFIGGRATEQKYHVVYKYRLTNRPNNSENMKWCKGETTVSGSRYRELRVGQTIHRNKSFLY